ncbi:hypothetical protein, unlikely [Trypanosoma brucei gambiense DAL972]|uniref:Uncharacterized protein n=1 Tax=Trypanosoma brucei gambiense (strain MHOM/CI/86/DAL972) TaxID=679716 RepID=D0A1N5_TRYB9|nr:hypothetical protein, unlikely [Trypanosoma brucei gambiense DAL972]CBH15178.1 hypothetical protein, unlikely [Trypanosoma brucei gambiense DAL972]|eukprot:XP_011777443.1 hypothetical protein, unlikely [Trypanosoma brucei gambiense DAL972]
MSITLFVDFIYFIFRFLSTHHCNLSFTWGRRDDLRFDTAPVLSSQARGRIEAEFKKKPLLLIS